MCLPVLARLWRPRHTGKIAHARELAELIAARYPDRTVHVIGDAAYVGERLRNLQNRITWTSRGEGHLGAARAATTAHRTVRATPHQRAPVGHTHRPCRQRHTEGPVA